MRAASHDIYLDNEKSSCYYGGRNVSGKVVLTFDFPKRIRGIEVKVLGKAQTYWTEQRRKGVVNVKGEMEQHVAMQKDLIGFKKNNEELTLAEGLHEFPFQFKLPLDIPSSFEGKYGRVNYEVQSTIFYCSKQRNHSSVSQSFRVQGDLDLNLEPNIRNWCELTRAKNLYCCCFLKGPIRLSLSIPKSGYIPGENIQFSAQLVNYSTCVVDVDLALVQCVTYHARNEIMSEIQKICEINGPTIDKGETEFWEGDVLKIPEGIHITRLGGSRIIEVEYFLKITMNTLTGKLPIKIGTTPVKSKELTYNNLEILNSFRY